MSTLAISLGVFFIIITLVLIFVVINLYRKNNWLEDQWLLQANYIASITKLMKEFDSLVDKVDTQIWVQSDPELHELFSNMKQMQAVTKEYTD